MKFSSKTFFTADNHFGHASILKHCNRPFANVEEMDAAMIEEWNNTVSHGNTVYILGDFAFNNHEYYLNRLNGKKRICIGNHDKMSLKVMEKFTEVFPGIIDRRFNGKQYTLCHYPMRSWKNSIHSSRHLYGHCHGRAEEYDNVLSFDIGVDVWGYKPVPLEIVELKFRLREEMKKINSTLFKTNNPKDIAKYNLSIRQLYESTFFQEKEDLTQ